MDAHAVGGPAAFNTAASASVGDHPPSLPRNDTMFHSIARRIHPTFVRLFVIISLNSSTRFGNVTPSGRTHGSCAASYFRRPISSCETMF
eukprot:29602-Pelagococcus_subviridis.AAC.4